MENEKISLIIKILENLKRIIETKETNMIYSIFDSKEELILELDTHIQKLEDKDFSKISDLILLFAPTSDLQEISISSGWSRQFLEISGRFDRVMKELIEEFNLKPF
jgi:hypothetical protein